MHQMQQALQQAKQGRHQQAAPVRGLLVLPYLSIVNEKTAHLSMLLEDMKWRVTGYKGEADGQPLSSKVRPRAGCSSRQRPQAATRVPRSNGSNNTVTSGNSAFAQS